MLTTLIVCLCLGTIVHAGSTSSAPSISTSTTTLDGSRHLITDATAPSSPVDVDEQQLTEIAASCLTNREQEQLAGGILRYGMARSFNSRLVNEAQKAIGLRELRVVAGFAPPGPWTAYRKPSRDEIDAAPTIEEYYELREPRSEARSLDSVDFFEWNFPPAIDFLDTRFPAIHTIYRHKFEAIRRRHPDTQVKIDKDEVDQMIKEYITISPRVKRAISDMLSNDQCW